MLGCTGCFDHARLLHGALGDLLGDATSTGSCQLLSPRSEGYGAAAAPPCRLLCMQAGDHTWIVLGACKQASLCSHLLDLLEPTQTESAARKPG